MQQFQESAVIAKHESASTYPIPTPLQSLHIQRPPLQVPITASFFQVIYFQLVTQAVPIASLQITENRERKKKKPEKAGKTLKQELPTENSHCLNQPVTAEDPVQAHKQVQCKLNPSCMKHFAKVKMRKMHDNSQMSFLYI